MTTAGVSTDRAAPVVRRKVSVMTGPMIPLAEPNLGDREAALLAECVRSGWVSSVGPFVDRFERDAAEVCGLVGGGAAAVDSGSAAIYLALRAAGVQAGDLVIVPSYTFIATANAVAMAGAEPWLMDIEPESWCLDAELMRDELARSTERVAGEIVHRATGRRVAAVVPVFTLGATPDMDAVRRVADGYGLPVIADAACAIGATYRGRPLATTADAVCLSFNGNKTLTCGGGGLVLSRDQKLVERVRHLSTQARPGGSYEHDDRGFNFRMTNLEAAVGCAQLARLDQLVGAKRAIRRRYDDALVGRFGLRALPSPAWCESSCWLSGVLLEEGVSAGQTAASLQAAGIGARPFWKPLHLQTPYAESPRSAMPVCESIWDRVLTLPCSTGLSQHEQERVIDRVPTVLAEAVRRVA